MTNFDVADAKAAESVGNLLNETVIWRPQVKSTSPYGVTPGGYPDPDRPIRQIEGVVSWQPLGLPVARDSPTVVTEASLMIDFEADLFRNEFAAYGQPKNGDRFELPDQDEADQLVKVERVGDDGSARVYCWCSAVTE
jgi:hypothetical protein